MQVLRESGAELVTFQLNVKQDNFQSLEKKSRACRAFLCVFFFLPFAVLLFGAGRKTICPFGGK